MTVQEQDKLIEQYIYEKSLYEQYGSHAIGGFNSGKNIRLVD